MRGGFKINRAGFGEKSGDRVDWLDDFANKTADKSSTTIVQQVRNRNQQSLFDQLSSIISHNPVKSSVESKVNQYQEMTGLTEHLRRMSQETEERKKIAQETEALPDIFKKIPKNVQNDIDTFVRNMCETYHGHIPLPSLVEEVSKVFRQQGITPQDVNDVKFEKYLNAHIIAAQQKNVSNESSNPNLGRGVGIDSKSLDSANYDIFEGLIPVKQ